MANTVAITIKVSDEDSSRKLENLQKQLDRLKGSGGDHFGGFAAGAKKASQHAVEFSTSSRNLREAIHALHPALEQLGLGFGNFAGLGASARGGIAVFAAALTGTLLVALEKAADASDRFKKSLSDLGATASQIQSLQNLGQQSGLGLGPVAENYRRYQHGINSLYGGPQPDYVPRGEGSGKSFGVSGDTLSKTFETLTKLTRIGSGSLTGGKDDLEKITRAIDEHRGITADDLKGLSPGTQTQIAKATGFPINPNSKLSPGQQLEDRLRSSGSYLPGDTIARGLAKAGPQIDKDFEKLTPGLDDAVGKVKTSLERLADDIGKSGLAAALEGLAKLIDAITPSNLKTGLHAIAHPVETGIILGGGAQTQAEAQQKAHYVLTGENPPAQIAGPQQATGVPSTLQTVPYALGGLVGRLPGFADGGLLGEIQEVINKRGAHHESFGKIGAEMNLFKLLFGRNATIMAAGGLLSGPGTGTSDSILARVSNGEYVLRASAVRAIGVSNLDHMNKYADGGLIGDDGGSSSAPHAVHLHIGGNQYTIPTHDRSVVDRLAREAVNDKILQIVNPSDAVR